MSDVQYEVKPLFVEPVFTADISHAISDDQAEYIKNLKMVQNKTNLISEDLYIFEDPKLKSIKSAIQKVMGIYAKEVVGISQKLYVTQSWALTNPPGVGMHGHSHSNSIVSGSLYYADLPKPVANMIFNRHRLYQQIELPPEPDKRTIYNTEVNVVQPKKGMVVLFSSSLQHLVEPNNTPEPRHSIAFNSFVKGTIGSHRDVSELRL
ncbi:hypothetical protein DDZ18_00690 [Marinicauda salina]|uniref:Fe2OG dioxygenase domain-containing protein n=1 Tax=Marinicauda salina TaxID=2135793 RepID=A0A2U2BW14_9PROT|nr:TIGR02466 family protein [Marinicauda salina]PWE18164.1 hypothetical protein DDZ18_00690 [Marinicauda salina]